MVALAELLPTAMESVSATESVVKVAGTAFSVFSVFLPEQAVHNSATVRTGIKARVSLLDNIDRYNEGYTEK